MLDLLIIIFIKKFVFNIVWFICVCFIKEFFVLFKVLMFVFIENLLYMEIMFFDIKSY